MWVDLNRIPKKLLFVTNIIVIILFILAIIFLLIEINYIKEHGGECLYNPLNWAEEFALKERGLIVDCSCAISDLNISQLNISGGGINGE